MCEKCFANTRYRRTPKTNVQSGNYVRFALLHFKQAPPVRRGTGGSFTIYPVMTCADRLVKRFRRRSCVSTAKKSCPEEIRAGEPFGKTRRGPAVIFSRNRLLKPARYVRWPNALIKTAAQSQGRRESFARGPCHICLTSAVRGGGRANESVISYTRFDVITVR